MGTIRHFEFFLFGRIMTFGVTLFGRCRDTAGPRFG
jgi:hypothetical protein